MLKKIFSSPGQRHVFILLALAVVVVYAQALQFDFVNWDDNINISANPEMIFPSLKSYWAYWSGTYGGLFTPIPFTFWTFFAQISQFIFRDPYPVPAFYHGLNIFVHILNTGLVFMLLLEILNRLFKPIAEEAVKKSKKKLAEPKENRSIIWAAGIGASLFALHPLQVESVAWATGFKDLIFGFCALVTLHLVICEKMREASVAYVIALLAKPTAVVLPFLGIWILFVSAQKISRQKFYYFGAWIVFAASDILVTRGAQSEANYKFFPTFWQKLVVAYDAVAFYLTKVLWPYPLAIDYGRSPEYMLKNDSPNWMWLLLLVVLVIAFLPWARRQKIPHGFVFTAITVLPVLGMIPFAYQISSTVADRYMYLGVFGFCVPIAVLLANIPKKALQYTAIAVIGIFGAFTFALAQTWQNSETLFMNALNHYPQSSNARRQLGAHYYYEDKYDLAEPVLNEQVKLFPDDPLAYVDLAMIYQKKGRPDEAVKILEKSLAIREQFADTHAQMAESLIELEKIPEAEKHLARALELEPNNYSAFYLQGNLLAKKKDYPGAKEKFLEALKYMPNNSEAHNNLGNTLAIMNDIRGAQLHFRIASKLAPKSVPAHLNFARTLLMTGDYSEAYQHLSYIMHLDPTQPEAKQLLEQMRSRLPGSHQ